MGKERLYFIDNTRGIASIFGVFFHVGLMLNTHATNLESTIDFTYYVRYFNIVRMPIFLFISGYFVYYSLKRYQLKHFLVKRFERIGIPLFFGFVLLLPLNTFLKNLLISLKTGVFEWHYTDFLIGFKWDQVWFLLHILLFSLIVAFTGYTVRKYPKLALIINRVFYFIFNHIIYAVVLFSLLIIIWRKFGYLAEGLAGGFFLRDILLFHNMLNNFGIFLLGAFAYKFSHDFLINIISGKRNHILILSGIYIVSVALDLSIEFDIKAFTTQLILISLLLLIFNLAKAYLNFTNRFFRYIAEASYPFYLLHFPMSLLFVYIYYATGISSGFIFADYIVLCIFTTLSTYFFYSFFINSNLVGRLIISGILPEKKTALNESPTRTSSLQKPLNISDQKQGYG
ncbi:MAG: acyltransferase family protein [Bacteroidales bacterium]